MAKKKYTEIEAGYLPEDGFTGLAFSLECHAHHDNRFRDYRIVKLNIENGVVTKKEYSDPYASFEAISRVELLVNKKALELAMEYKNGKTIKW